jgi:formylglycine-generating enzyme required for sulfatase activity
LVISEANATHDGNYTVSVTNNFGSVESAQIDLQTNTHRVTSAANLEMIWVADGNFTMGSPTSETGRSSSETEHNVSLTQGFYLGKYEVTQAQYAVVMSGNTNSLNPIPSNWPNNPNRPVEQVSWDDVQIFLTRLNASEQAAGRLPSGWSYVLPTEAEWEYACRAGTTTAYSWGTTIATSNANYNNTIGQTTDVGQYAANPWGFFDMHGNVYEWTADRYGTYPTGNPVIDPTGPASGSYRVGRGGFWINGGTNLRSAKRNGNTPSARYISVGFRVGFKHVQPDRANPELVLSGGVEVTHVAGQAWAEPGVAAHDVRDGNLSGRVSVSGLVDVNRTGLYVLTYTVSDTAGNLATANRKVRVTPPAPTTATYLVPTAANLEMIWVADGNFTMGSPTTEPGRSTTTDRETEHNVTLTRGFYLGKYEVTQAQYAVVMSGNTNSLNPSPSQWPNNPNRPVEKVSWDDVQIFLSRLNASEQAAGRLPSGWSYVLPTEAEWEYACRAGTTTAYSWGATIASSDANWNHGSDANQTENVGQYAANPWGFFDMHGNVFEWTADWYAVYSSGAQTDPTGPASGSDRVVRGGAWRSTGAGLRSAGRVSAPGNRYYDVGFRVGFKQQ